MELLNGLLVVTEILLAANEDDGEALAEMQDFGDPLELVLAKGGKGRSVRLRTFSWTLSRESGESMAKQIRITWESGYESGRRRS